MQSLSFVVAYMLFYSLWHICHFIRCDIYANLSVVRYILFYSLWHICYFIRCGIYIILIVVANMLFCSLWYICYFIRCDIYAILYAIPPKPYSFLPISLTPVTLSKPPHRLKGTLTQILKSSYWFVFI